MRALAILIEPNGTEWFSAYGPHTQDRAEATRYLNPAVAVKVAVNAIFGDREAFWPSERESARLTRAAHRGWSYRIEEVSD